MKNKKVYLLEIYRNYTNGFHSYVVRLYQEKPTVEQIVDLFDEYVGDVTDMPQMRYLETNHREDNKNTHPLMKKNDEFKTPYGNYMIKLEKKTIH